MRHLSDYLTAMTNRSTIDDVHAEMLLAGDLPEDHEFAAVGVLLDDLRRTTSTPTHPSTFASRLAATARSGRSQDRPPRLGRIASVGLAGVLFFGTAGVAWAADSASPGEFLYGFDMALESIGIGVGGFDERALEFRDLVDSGRANTAAEFLSGIVEEYGKAAAATVLDKVATETDGDGAFAGRPPGSDESGPPENAGPKQDTTTNPQDKTTGPPENAGPKQDTTTNPQDKTTGPPENAGPKDK